MQKRNDDQTATAHNNYEIYRLLQQIGREIPHLTTLAINLIGHYDGVVSDPYQQARKKLAVLTFLLTTYETATKRLAQNQQMSIRTAEKFVLTSINEGPEDWLADEKLFAERGLVRGETLYYAMFYDTKAVSEFQNVRTLAHPAHQPIMRAALDCVYSRETDFGITLEPYILPYIAALLVSGEEQKQAAFIKLKSGVPLNRYMRTVEKSQTVVKIIAGVLEIDVFDLAMSVPSLEEIKAPVVKTEMKESLTRVVNTVASPKAAAKKEKELSGQLSWLVHRGEISPIEQKAYMAISKKKEEGRTPSVMEIQSLLTRGGHRASYTEAASFERRVENSLEILRNDLDRNPFKYLLR